MACTSCKAFEDVEIWSRSLKFIISVQLLLRHPVDAKWVPEQNRQPSVMACTCNSATLESEFRNGVGSIPVEGNSHLIGWWIVW